MKRIISVILVVIIALSTLASCSSVSVKVAPTPETVNVPKTTNNDVKKDNYELMSENEYSQLFLNKDTTHFRVVNKKDGLAYDTKKKNPSVNVENSLFDISFLDTKSNIRAMNSYSDSVVNGQYKIDTIDNGFKISYTVGDVQEKLFCPVAIKEEKFKKILDKIEDTYDRQFFKGYYYLIDYEKLDDTKKPDVNTKYPIAKSEKIYVLKAEEIAVNVQRDINKVLVSTGYTDKEYEEDSKNSTLTTTASEPAFNLNLYVTLNADRLNVRMPISEIKEFNGGSLLDVNMLKTFAAPEKDQKGYFVLPDGSGSKMNFYNGAATQEVISAIYGKDDGTYAIEKSFPLQQAYLPIFIAKFEDGGAVLGEVVDSESNADIITNTGTDKTYAGQYATFRVREKVKTFLSAAESAADFFYITQKKLYDKDVSIDYKFFEKGNDEIVNITEYYKNKIFKAEKKASDIPPVYLEFIGVAKEKEVVMGQTSFKKVTYTTIKQVKEKTQELLDAGTTNLVLKLSGFLNDGLDASVLSKAKLNKTVGTEAELKDLMAFGKQNNIPIYLDADVQYNSENGMFDGFSAAKNSSYTLDRYTAIMTTYDLATFGFNMENQAVNQIRYTAKPESITAAINTIDTSFKKFGVTCYSFDKAGELLNSNFKKDKEVTRQQASNMIANDISKIAQNNSVLVKGANRNVLPFIDHAMNIPVQSLRYENTNGSIPLLQMVLGGKVNYTGPASNLTSDVIRDNLDTLRTGSGFHFVLIGDEKKDFAKTAHKEILSNKFDFWKQNIIDKAKTLRDLSPVTSKGIKSYEMLQKDVYITTYGDNNYMITNYTEKEFDYNGTKVAPLGYAVGKVGG